MMSIMYDPNDSKKGWGSLEGNGILSAVTQ